MPSRCGGRSRRNKQKTRCVGLDLAAWEENYRCLVTRHAWAEVASTPGSTRFRFRRCPLCSPDDQFGEAERRRPTSISVPSNPPSSSTTFAGPSSWSGDLPSGFFDSDFPPPRGETSWSAAGRHDWERGHIAYMRASKCRERARRTTSRPFKRYAHSWRVDHPTQPTGGECFWLEEAMTRDPGAFELRYRE